MICVSKADSIAHQTSGSGIVAKFINGWNGVTSSQLNEFFATGIEVKNQGFRLLQDRHRDPFVSLALTPIERELLPDLTQFSS